MEKQVIFRDRQELQYSDLNNIELYTTNAIDRVVREGLTNEKKFSGFSVEKSAATTVRILPGTYWVSGERYIREDTPTIDFLGQLPLATKKIAAIIVVAANVENDVEPRDFLIDTDTGATEPDSVAMQRMRYAQFQTAYGVENATPQRPTISSDALVVAWVTLSTTGVDTIEAASENEFMSIKRLHQRATELEVWKEAAGEQITTLGSDITNLSSKIGSLADSALFVRIFADVAALKEAAELDDNYSGYGAEHFLVEDQSISDPTHIGYRAKVEEGIRFPDDNASDGQISLFNPLEPTVKQSSNGLIIPKYSEVRRISVDTFYQDLSLSQYEYQEITFKDIAMSAKRLRFGLARTVCTNGEFWKSGKYDPAKGVFTDKLGRTYQVLDTNNTSTKNQIANHTWIRVQEYWYDTETEYYQQRVVTEYTVQGAMVAQTFLNTQGGWLTSLDLYFTQKAATGDVRVLLTRTDAGKPLLDQVVAETTLAAAAIVKGTNPATASHWTRIPFIPTALVAGERYSIVLITGGNHFVGLAQGVRYAAGTLFYSTDGDFFQGDLTLDMMFRANFASFDYNRIEVNLGSVNLGGGIIDIDLAFEGIAPEGTSLTFELRPEGSATWYQIGGNGNPFVGLPALANMRAVFTGTKDMMPGFKTTGSNVKVSRPALTFTHFTEPLPMPVPTQSLKVIVMLDYYNEANHEFDVVLIAAGNAGEKAPATEVDEIIEDRDGARKRIKRTMTWTAAQLPTATSSIVIKSTGSIVSAAEVFHVERLTWLSFA